MPSLVSPTVSLASQDGREQGPWSQGAGVSKDPYEGAHPRTRPKSRFPKGTTLDIRVGFHECGPARAAR